MGRNICESWKVTRIGDRGSHVLRFDPMGEHKNNFGSVYGWYEKIPDFIEVKRYLHGNGLGREKGGITPRIKCDENGLLRVDPIDCSDVWAIVMLAEKGIEVGFIKEIYTQQRELVEVEEAMSLLREIV